MPTTRELLQQLTATRKAQQEAEQPVRQARRKITSSLQSARDSLHKANLKLSKELTAHVYGYGGWHLREIEQHVAGRIERFNQVLTTLRTFDALQGIDADYPVAPEVDREATVAAAKEERRQALAKFRTTMGAIAP